MTPEEEAALKQPILDKYEEEGNPYYSTAHSMERWYYRSL